MSKVIITSNGGQAIVDDDMFDELSKYSWNTDPKGYARRRIQKDRKSFTELMHRRVMRLPAGHGVVDHINRNRLDNRRENLRLCTYSQNSMNRSKPSHNTSGFKGVSQYKGQEKWSAQIGHMGRLIHLGYFDTPELASEAYKRAATVLHGEFACISDAQASALETVFNKHFA